MQGPFGPFLAQSKPIRGQIRTQRKISGPLVASDPIQHAFGRFSSFLPFFRWKQAILRPDSDSSCPCHIYGTKNHENRSMFDRPSKIRAVGPLGWRGDHRHGESESEFDLKWFGPINRVWGNPGIRGPGIRGPGDRGSGGSREGPGAKVQKVAICGWSRAFPTSDSESLHPTI